MSNTHGLAMGCTWMPSLKPLLVPPQPGEGYLKDSNESKGESHSVVSDSLQPHVLCSPWNSPGQNTEVGSLSLLQEIFPTRGSNPGLPHFWQILYQLSHQGSPKTEVAPVKSGQGPGNLKVA